MADQAELQIKVGSAQVGRAGKALDDFGKSAQRSAQATDQARDSLGRFERKIETTSDKAKNMAKQFLGLAAALKAIKIIADFSEQMAALQGVLGITTDELAVMEVQIRSLGATTRFSATEVAKAQTALARTGLTMNEVMAATADTLNLATAGQLSLARAAEIAAITMKQFGLQAEDINHITNVLVLQANSSATNIEQLAQAMKFAGGIANSFGVSMESAAGAIGVMSNAGLQATQAGTGLRGILASLSAPTARARGQLEAIATQLGVTTDAFDLGKNSLEDIIQRFADAGVGADELLVIFNKLQAPAALALVKGIKKFKEFSKENKKVGQEAKKIADLFNKTFAGSIKNLISSVEELVLGIGDSLVGTVLKGLIDVLAIVFRSLAGMNDQTSKWATELKILEIILKLIAGALAAVVIRMIAVKAAAFAASVATTGLTASLARLKLAITRTGFGALVVGAAMFAEHLANISTETEEMIAAQKDLEATRKKLLDLTIAQNKEIEKAVKLERAKLGALRKEVKAYQDMFETVDELSKTNVQLSAILGGKKGTADLIDVMNGVEKASNDFLASFGLKKGDLIPTDVADTLKVFQASITNELLTQLDLKKDIAAKERRIDAGRAAAQKARQARLQAANELLQLQAKLTKEASFVTPESEISKVTDKVQELFIKANKLEKTPWDHWSDVLKNKLNKELDRAAINTATIADNADFNKLKSRAEAGAKSIQSALEGAQFSLSSLLFGDKERVSQEINRKFSEVFQEFQKFQHRLADIKIGKQQALLNNELISKEEFKAEVVAIEAVAAKAIQSLSGKVDQIKQAVFEESIRKQIAVIDQNLRKLEASADGSIEQMQEFKDETARALALYQMLVDSKVGFSQDQFAQKQTRMNEKVAEFARLTEEAMTADKAKQLARDLAQTFGDAFEDIIFNIENTTDALKNLGRELTKVLVRNLFIQPLVAGIGGGLESLIPSANGNAFDKGNVIPFARGGIIDKPTTFPMGLAGEAGPEAILPLSRGPNGKLGVASTGGGSGITVVQNINVANNDSFRQSERQRTADAFAAASSARRTR